MKLNSLNKFVIPIIALVTGCTKENNDKISGIVIDYTTRQPIPGATVTFYKNIPGTFLVANYEYWTYPEFSTTAANLNLPILFTTITDNNGIYHTEIPAQPPSRPLITIASKEGHATVFPNSFSFMSPTTGYYPTPGDSLYLDKNSYIQFRINNTAPVSNQDTFFIRRRNIHTNDWIFGIAPDRFNVYFGAANNIIIDSVFCKTISESRNRMESL